ncbi:biotin synthase BioB [Pseudoflavonifractor phocaeensis]|uniref:biotin synthase BioB n=1 Tax=Pseudoflavonifractor phocaeensis TaxID=1870988 RepID=UPI001F2B3810|nr:biotin synthase BioB [Pseudoflavonifractor phocaeensis]MCF2595240.1 biotin synthase BioB [Pseudoflavonifractor phocaeensis]
MKHLAEEIIVGRRLGREDDLSVLVTADLEELCQGADRIRKALCGDRFDLCTIINGRSGRCGENCKFCAQSCHNHTNVEEYPFLPLEEIVAEGKRNEAAGIHRYSIVTAGRGLYGQELEQGLAAYRRLKAETGLALCASHGLQTLEELKAMKEAGVERFHANLETSRRYFPSICTTHTYQDKVDNILRAKEAGLQVCSGGILGMGETWEDRIDMALSLAELEVDSIPLNLLSPIPGTPLEGVDPISREDVLRSVAVFRYINPTAWIRMAAGRGRFEDGGEALFRSGANAAITGDMLTTTGTSVAGDIAMAARLGYQLEK